MEIPDAGYELIVSQPSKPLWRVFLAAVFFTMALYAIYSIVTQPHFSHLDSDEITYFDVNVIFIIIGLFIGIYCSVIATIKIDIDSETLITQYSVGPFFRSISSKIPQLDYVDLQKNSDDIYLIRIWYSKNKRYTLCYTEDKIAALKFAKMVSIKLHLDLLDATEKDNHRWIEKQEIESLNPEPTSQNQ